MTFSRGVTGLSQVPLFAESILGVTVESVPGNQVLLEWTGITGSFGMVARHLAFLSPFKWRPLLLELRQESLDSFPDEAGK